MNAWSERIAYIEQLGFQTDLATTYIALCGRGVGHETSDNRPSCCSRAYMYVEKAGCGLGTRLEYKYTKLQVESSLLHPPYRI